MQALAKVVSISWGLVRFSLFHRAKIWTRAKTASFFALVLIAARPNSVKRTKIPRKNLVRRPRTGISNVSLSLTEAVDRKALSIRDLGTTAGNFYEPVFIFLNM